MAEERVFDREASMLDAERQSSAIQAGIVRVGGVSPTRGRHDLARERADDLIVVVARDALLGRVLLGDDARSSLDGAPCAVAIAPRGYADSVAPALEIAVGYDGAESDHALAVRG
jgi:hypothetical protein